MKFGLKTLIRDSLFYFSLNSIPRVLSFITIPILTRIFIPSEYGIIETVGAVTSLITSFLVLGMGPAIFRFYPEYEGIEKRELISTVFWLRELFAITIVILMILLAPLLSNTIFKTDKYYTFLIIAFLAIPFALAADIGAKNKIAGAIKKLNGSKILK